MYHNIKAILIGFLGADGEQRTTKNGASYTVLSLATKRSCEERRGELRIPQLLASRRGASWQPSPPP